MSVPRGKKADNLIINGVECEPYLTSDHRLMVEKGSEILVGVELLKRAMNISVAHIGIENNKPDAIQLLRKLAMSYKGIEVHALRIKYPQGAEKQLIRAILRREVPSGGLPVDVGVVAFNVGTVYAIYEAVQKNKPLFERIVTVTGKSLKQPANYRVRIGTPVSMLVQCAGGLPKDTGKIISGGPMMGKTLINLDVPVVKGTSGILILPSEESRRKSIEPCVRCSKCVSACPMGLAPYLLMPLSEQKNYDRLEMEYVMDCMECGSCSYICPANRPILDFIRLGKLQVGKIIRSRKQ
jgi:electron transport complex protein RnfC